MVRTNHHIPMSSKQQSSQLPHHRIQLPRRTPTFGHHPRHDLGVAQVDESAPHTPLLVLRKAHSTRLRRVPDSTTYMGINAFIDLRPELLPDELPYSVELQVLARPRFLLCHRYPPNTLRVGHSSTRRPV